MSATDSATSTASTKRSPAVAGGKVASPVVNVSSVLIVPLCPVSAALIQELQIKSPREMKETFAFGALDILEGDILTVSGVDYLINYVKEYSRPADGSYLHILLQERKAA